MKKLLVGGVLLALIASPAAAQKLTGVTTTKVGDGLKVSIQGEDLAQPKIIRVMGGKSFMLEFDAHLVGKPQRIKANFSGVDFVESVWFKARPPKVRVHVRMNPENKIKVDEADNGWEIKINVEESAKAPALKVGLPTGSSPLVKPVLDSKPKLDVIPIPDSVPPYVDQRTVKPNTGTNSSTNKVAAYQPTKRVSLDFVNTDVVQILKAITIQTDVNVVTSPDVKGNLTVSLADVTIDEALDLVTTLAGLRYARVGNTYVVTTAEKFSETMRKMSGRVEESFETRVVPIYSGEGVQIKAAVLKSVPMSSTRGTVEIVLPSEEINVAQKATVGDTGGGQGTQGGTQGGGTTVETRTGDGGILGGKKDPYVVLIGQPSRLDEVESIVRRIDEQIARALGVEIPSQSAKIRTVYRPQGNSAAALLQAITGGTATATGGQYKATIGNVDLFATPSDSISEQVIVLHGRETEVNQILQNLRSIDTVSESKGDYLIYDVKHLDPRSLREELIVQVPGLAVNIPPSSVANPNTFTANAIQREAAERTGGNGQTGAGGAGGAAGQGNNREGQVSLTGETGQDQGITLPFKDFENVAVPMKLVLRGTKEQIQRAVSYLQAIDTAPKQVALELRVMEMTKEEALKVGINWDLLTGGTVQSLNVAPSGTEGSGISSVLGFGGGGSLDIRATLDQIATKNNLIARPNLLAIDGRQSELFVGDVVRYIETIQSSQNGVTVTTGTVPVGVRLAVLPRIGGDDTITMELRPVVSVITGFTPVPGGGQLPQTSLRVAQSTMMIKSGETIAIGGLIQDQDRKVTSGIPVLKDLPLVGFLFRRTDNSRRRSEVVFFLTAKVVDATNRANAANPKSNDEPKNNAKTDKIGN